MVEFYANNPNDPPDYLIGEQLYKSGTSALRSMYHPSLDGASADCWYCAASARSTSTTRRASPTTSSTCWPRAPRRPAVRRARRARRATRGRPPATARWPASARDKAEKIWYRALTVYLTSSTNYAGGARRRRSARPRDLYGAGSAEHNAVAAAWSAVNVN